jgi:hypothetical protein
MTNLDMKRFFLLVSFVFLSLTITAQDTDSTFKQNKGFIRLHFLIPGVDYEKPFSNNFTCKIALLSGVGFGKSIGGWDFTPYISAEQRYYFSFGKSTYPNRKKYFSNLYLSLQEIYIFETSDFIMGPVIGYQYTFGRIWYIDLGLGPGFYINNQDFSVSVIGNFSIGLILDFF